MSSCCSSTVRVSGESSVFILASLGTVYTHTQQGYPVKSEAKAIKWTMFTEWCQTLDHYRTKIHLQPRWRILTCLQRPRISWSMYQRVYNLFFIHLMIFSNDLGHKYVYLSLAETRSFSTEISLFNFVCLPHRSESPESSAGRSARSGWWWGTRPRPAPAPPHTAPSPRPAPPGCWASPGPGSTGSHLAQDGKTVFTKPTALSRKHGSLDPVKPRNSIHSRFHSTIFFPQKLINLKKKKKSSTSSSSSSWPKGLEWVKQIRKQTLKKSKPERKVTLTTSSHKLEDLCHRFW